MYPAIHGPKQGRTIPKGKGCLVPQPWAPDSLQWYPVEIMWFPE